MTIFVLKKKLFFVEEKLVINASIKAFWYTHGIQYTHIEIQSLLLVKYLIKLKVSIDCSTT